MVSGPSSGFAYYYDHPEEMEQLTHESEQWYEESRSNGAEIIEDDHERLG
jgi:hypothetical protein